jgi:hypothetical protein
MPSHGDVRDFDVVVIGAHPGGEAAAELGGVLGYPVALFERDIVATRRRIGKRSVRLIHGEARLVAGHPVAARTGDGTQRRLCPMRLPSRARRI